MGRFATGVTVVTTTQRDTIHGMTANAFLSVSLRPPLVLVSLGTVPHERDASADGALRSQCARQRSGSISPPTSPGSGPSPVAPKFVWHEDLPLLGGALAHIGCRVVDVHTAGDHVLWIGEVEHLSHRDGEPLLFYTGQFGTLREVSDRVDET